MAGDEPNSYPYFIKAAKSKTQNFEYSQILKNVNKYLQKGKKLNQLLFISFYFLFYTVFYYI